MNLLDLAVVTPIVLPLLMAPLTLILPPRLFPWGHGLVSLLNLLAVGLLMDELMAGEVLRYRVGGWGAPLGIDLYVDGFSLAPLLLTALVMPPVSFYAHDYLGNDPEKRLNFWPLWYLLWTGLNASVLSADIFNIYVTLEVLTLAAVPLVVLAGGVEALRGAIRYLLFALLGSLSYLLGVAMLFAVHGSLDLLTIGEQWQGDRMSGVGLALITVGLLAKGAIFPLHIWLPPAHSAAPAPVSAVLSALVVKIAFYILARLWFWTATPTPGAAAVLGTLGGLAVAYGSLQALRQGRLKLIVAYSTVAQLGYLLLLFPLAGSAALTGSLLQMLGHGLAKASLFLAAGNVLKVVGHDRVKDLAGVGRMLPTTWMAVGVATVTLTGLPPSVAFLGKWRLLEAALNQGHWWWIVVLVGGGLLAAGYLFRVLACAFMDDPSYPGVHHLPWTLTWMPLFLAILALLMGLVSAPLEILFQSGSPFPEAL